MELLELSIITMGFGFLDSIVLENYEVVGEHEHKEQCNETVAYTAFSQNFHQLLTQNFCSVLMD